MHGLRGGGGAVELAQHRRTRGGTERLGLLCGRGRAHELGQEPGVVVAPADLAVSEQVRETIGQFSCVHSSRAGYRPCGGRVVGDQPQPHVVPDVGQGAALQRPDPTGCGA